MWKIYFVFIGFLVLSNQSTAQTYTWTGVPVGGDYTDATNWTPTRTTPSTADILVFNTATNLVLNFVPNQTISAIKINSGTGSVSFGTATPGNVLTLNAAVPLIYTTPGSILAADFLTISTTTAANFTMASGTFGIAPGTGGKVIINGALTLNGGALNFDVPGTGGATINGTVTYTTGTFTSASSSSISWSNNSVYNHNSDGATASAIPTSTWQGGSTCNITGMNAGNIAPTGLTASSFSNFTWNCPSQFGTVTLLPTGSIVNINGTLTISAMGGSPTKELQLSSGKATLTAALYTQTNGTFTLQSGTDTTTLSVLGNFTQTLGGTLNGVGGTATGGFGMAIVDLKGSVINMASPALWQSTSPSTGSQLIFQFSGTGLQSVTTSNSRWQTPVKGRCSIVISNTDAVNGVNLASGPLKVANTASPQPATFTLSGLLTSTGGNVSYTDPSLLGTTLIYSGSLLQSATAVEFPSSGGPLNLTINNSLGVNFPLTNFTRIIAGTLTMVSGNLALAGDTLSLTNASLSAQLSYTAGFITTGTLGRSLPISGLPTAVGSNSLFPFGTGVNDRSLNVFFSSSTVATGGTAGMIYVTHTPISGVVQISPAKPDNGSNLDKRTLTNWTVSAPATGGFNLGTSGVTISLTVVAANIGAVDNIVGLRLTDAITFPYGTGLAPNPNTGSTSVPVTGKSGLVMTDLNKPLYIGSDGTTVFNPLINITFTWIGTGSTNDWTDPGNWTGLYAVGYPSASTEIAIITSTSSFQPTISSGTPVSLYQLTVGSGMTLTMAGSSLLNVYDNISFAGNASFSPTSTFGYSSSNTTQNIVSLIYGGLSVSGSATKNLPASLTVTGTYTISGSVPAIGTSNFIYAGAGAQRITAAKYYNLTITGSRSGGLISLGNTTTSNTIDINSVFDISSLSSYTVKNDYNTVAFSSGSSQNIPGFSYNIVSNTGGGTRVLDNLGSTVPSHVISCLIFNRQATTPAYTITNSKIKFFVSGGYDVYYSTGDYYWDLEYSGNLKNFKFGFNPGPIYVAGNFAVSLTNYQQPLNTVSYIVFTGTGDQTITPFHTTSATNTPAFKYPNIIIQGGNRSVTLGNGSPTDTVGVTGTLAVPAAVTYNTSNYYTTIPVNPFTPSPGKGFIVDNSTVSFSIGSSSIPLLIPSIAGAKNYNNVYIKGGTHNFADNMTIGGNLTVTGDTALAGILNVGDGNSTRVINVLGNILDSGLAVGSVATAQIDMNTGTKGKTTINLAGNLTIKGNGQLMGTTTSAQNGNGVVVFNGTAPQTYSNVAAPTLKNGLVNFKVGDGTTATNLSLLSSMNLLAGVSGSTNKDTITVSNNASLNCGTNNIISNGTGSAAFNLNAGATFITANMGGIEGNAAGTTDGTIYNGSAGPTMTRTYNDTASYTFSGATTTPFNTASAISKMANLTIGANVTLDKSVAVSNTFNLTGTNPVFSLANSYLNLRSTASATAKVAPVPAGANIIYGTGRFVVERYYPARRGWRLVTAPITADAGKTVFNSWQMGGATTTGSGTFVTGPGAPLNGLDWSPRNNFSLYSGTGSTLTGVSNSFTQLISGPTGTQGTPDNYGFFMFVRGDRSSTNVFNTNDSSNTTLRDTGKIQIQTQTKTLTGPAATATTGFELVGNPFASQIDMNAIMASGISNINPLYIWVYDPYLNGDTGGYITLSLILGVWVAVPASLGGLTTNIQSSQAFYVQRSTNTTNSAITFTENNKTSSTNLGQFRPMSAPASLSANLYLLNADSSATIADGVMAIFDAGYSNNVDQSDAMKFGNVKETFGLLRSNKSLVVERRSTIQSDDTLFFKLTKTTQRQYQFRFEPSNMDQTLTAYLEDNYTGLKTRVSLSTPDSFNFIINGDAKSAAADRFRIVFKSGGGSTLPVTFSSIKAYQQGDNIAVNWTTANEINISKYTVEKSTDGVNFTKVNTTAAKGANSASADYTFLDLNAVQGNNFYRVVCYSQTGAVEYSRVVVVKIGATGKGISIYPNPVSGNSIGITFNNMGQGIYSVKLINTLGQTLMMKQLNHAAGSSTETLTPGNILSAGIYQLEVMAPDKSISAIKVVVQ